MTFLPNEIAVKRLTLVEMLLRYWAAANPALSRVSAPQTTWLGWCLRLGAEAEMSRNAGEGSARSGPGVCRTGLAWAGRGSSGGKEQAPRGAWLAGARSSTRLSRPVTAAYFQTGAEERMCIVIVSVKTRGGWKLLRLHKNQLIALLPSFLVKAREEKGQRWAGIVFRSRFYISAITSQHFMLSFFVLAPTHSVGRRAALLLPAPSNTQPKRCCFEQVLKDAGVPPPMDAPPHWGAAENQTRSLWVWPLERGTKTCPHLTGKQSHKSRSGFKVHGYHGNIGFPSE